MKQLILSALLLVGLNLGATNTIEDLRPVAAKQVNTELNGIPAELSNMTVDEFLTLTPRKVKEITGKKMSLKQVVTLKAAQKVVKKQMNSEKGSGADGKSQVIALVLCALVGYLGVHRFYLGYTTIGIIQLLTLGGCGIWTLIDLIKIITGDLKPAKGNYDQTL